MSLPASAPVLVLQVIDCGPPGAHLVCDLTDAEIAEIEAAAKDSYDADWDVIEAALDRGKRVKY